MFIRSAVQRPTLKLDRVNLAPGLPRIILHTDLLAHEKRIIFCLYGMAIGYKNKIIFMMDIILDLYFIFGQNVLYLTNGQRRVVQAIQLVFYSAMIKYLQNIIQINNVFLKNKII